jgi:hypothetical protein
MVSKVDLILINLPIHRYYKGGTDITLFVYHQQLLHGLITKFR